MTSYALDDGLEGLAVAARAALVRQIAAGGAFDDDPALRAAFAEVPRHLFVPYYYVGSESAEGGYERLWGEDPDPGRRAGWLRGAYQDSALATRVRDGELLSSSSQPSLMARMLADLRLDEGHTVLEIGAGTGYNAALLAHRLGDEQVTTVDLDPEITDSARDHLAAAGYRPAVVTGDGTRGCPERAPYDRIIATCTLDDLPRPWLAQCRPGARILTPFATGLVALEAQGPDRAEGRFLPSPAYFVPLRGSSRGAGRRSPAPPSAGRLPRGALEDDSFRFLLVLTEGRLGPREALRVWDREGHPGRERYGITVDGERAWVWLDAPRGPYGYGWEL
ncbi:methyltransferase domain-containing protein [Streptomyces sp. TS71-3]|uniref:methyltransferase domain-containing protein n=1 Tax=Streptomyces sp. TS71-3 TaxID=2733862 RepID=UPI001B1D2FE8|nr:methyltransferase domain-containing protein [Streptomyces sp. TS71-3]GHJ37557.1 O-methyltransferase [Streptomyces sp. TS71-3]